MRYLILTLLLVLATVAPAPAASLYVFKDGLRDVTVPAGQFISVFTVGSARVSKRVGFPNLPASFSLETGGEFSFQEKHFGPYTTETVVRIEALANIVLYSVGASAAIVPNALPVAALVPPSGSVVRAIGLLSQKITSTAKNAAATLTAAELLGGEITVTHTTGGTLTHTLPTGTLMDAAGAMEIGDSFEWTLINLSAAAADSVTIAAGTNHTIVGSAIVISAHVTTGGAITSQGVNSARFRTRKTAANTYVTTRIG